jgi:hypothetical protein
VGQVASSRASSRPLLASRLRPVVDGSAWSGDELAADRSWVYELDASMSEECERALEHVRNVRERPARLEPEQFPVPSAGAWFESVLRELEHGRGLALVHGVPVADRPFAECELLFAGLTAHLGSSIPQDTHGTLIDHVADRGLSYDQISVRGYTTNAQLTPHCDSGDLVALLCISPARRGGVNTVCSSLAVYNEILEHDPELLEPLFRGFHYNIRGNGPPGPSRDLTGHRVPVFSWHAGRLSCRFNEKAILTSEQLPGAPALSELEKRAVDTVARLAMEPRFSVEVPLRAGDLLLLCNHTVFHNRTSFEDGEQSRRLLLRQWINVRRGRPLTWAFGDHYNTGIRQGPHVDRPVDASAPHSRPQ